MQKRLVEELLQNVVDPENVQRFDVFAVATVVEVSEEYM